MPTWPASLPQCPVLPVQETPQNNVAAFQPFVGDAKTRRRSTANGAMLGATFAILRSQLATFDVFYGDDLKDGALAFDWRHPVTGVTQSWKFEAPPQKTWVAPTRVLIAVRLRMLP